MGVLPYLHDLALDAEDAVAIANKVAKPQLHIAVLLLPHISNHTDFDVLRLQPEIDLHYVRHTQSIPDVDLIIIPGSKNVLSDLAFLKNEGWDKQIHRHLRYSGKVLGICGGLQMLGMRIADPHSVESTLGEAKGLGIANFETQLGQQKVLTQVTGILHLNSSEQQVCGYEIHAGISEGPAFYNV